MGAAKDEPLSRPVAPARETKTGTSCPKAQKSFDQLSLSPADYKRQAAFDAERAAFVRMTSAELLNEGLGWNAGRGYYEAKMRPGESIRLEFRAFPGNATDTNLYWYCGNMPTFSPIGLDQVLSIPERTKPGEFLVYDARNDARQIVCRLRVDVIAPPTSSPNP